MVNIDTPEEERAGLVIIILCGLIGSGKSTFSTALQREFPEFRRCNQDELGRRADVEREVEACLSQGRSVCVDRTNIDPGQRRTWIELARQYPNVEIWGLEMDTPYDCHDDRLGLSSTANSTHRSPNDKDPRSRTPKADFIPIDAAEGFNRVFRLSPHDSIEYDRQELEKILANVRASPYFESPRLLPSPSGPARGRGSYPVHGRGRGYVYDRGFQSHGWRSNQPVWGPNPAASSWEPRAPRPAIDGNWRTRSPAPTSDRGRGFPGGYRGRGGGYGPYPRRGTPDRGSREPSVSDSSRDESGSAQNTGDRREEFEF